MDAVAKVGRAAPDFELADLEGEVHRLSEARGKVVVLNFWSAECPWSRRADPPIQQLSQTWGDRLRLWSVASNANESKQALRDAAQERGVDPVLVDDDQKVADLYGAVTTPHVFVIDAEGVLRYAGAPTDATWRQPEPTRNYLDDALKFALRGETAKPAETSARGCALVRYAMD